MIIYNLNFIFSDYETPYSLVKFNLAIKKHKKTSGVYKYNFYYLNMI